MIKSMLLSSSSEGEIRWNCCAFLLFTVLLYLLCWCIFKDKHKLSVCSCFYLFRSVCVAALVPPLCSVTWTVVSATVSASTVVSSVISVTAITTASRHADRASVTRAALSFVTTGKYVRAMRWQGRVTVRWGEDSWTKYWNCIKSTHLPISHRGWDRQSPKQNAVMGAI